MSEGISKVYAWTIMDDGFGCGMVFYCPETGSKKSAVPSDYYDRMATTPFQTHSLNVRVVDSIYDWHLPDTDALVTFKDDVPLGVRTADCVPIILYAEDVNGTAAIHAGWRGTLGGIVDNTLDVLEEKGADLSKMKAVFGPSISKEWYEVDNDLAEKFVEAGFGAYVSYPNGADGKPHLDLQGVNIERLRRRGLRLENIKPSDFCTFSSRGKDGKPLFPSYRRDKTADRLLTSIIRLDEFKLEAERRHWESVFKWAAENENKDK